MAEPPQSTIIVLSVQDSKKFKMVMKGDLNKLTIRKLKKYLVASTGVPAEEQILHLNGQLLHDDNTGLQIGLRDNTTLTLSTRPLPPHHGQYTGGRGASPRYVNNDIETLDQQRATIERERRKRDEDFTRQAEAYAHSIHSVEQQRRVIEADIAEKDFRLRKLAEEENRTLRERAHIEETRRVNHEREMQRVRDLDERRKQLETERERVRMVELRKVEVDQKEQLLFNTRRDFHIEKEKLDREKREFEDHLRQHELQIREREVALERERLEADKKQKLIESEKKLFMQQKKIEEGLLQKESKIDQLRMYEIQALPRISSSSISSPTPPITTTTLRQTSSPHFVESSRGLEQTHAAAPVVDIALRHKEQELERLRTERLTLERQRHLNTHSPRSGAERELDAMIQRERDQILTLTTPGGQPGNGVMPTPMGIPLMAPPPPTTPGPHQTPPPAPVPERLRDLARFEALPMGSSGGPKGLPTKQTLYASSTDSLRMAEENLKEFARELCVDDGLKFDDNNTCVVSVEDKYTLLITFDASTERLYLYSTLLTFLPKQPNIRLRLYEFLLEGALLGRDMAGGGVGVSVKNDFVLMSTSVFLPKSHVGSLKALAPIFVDSIVKWRNRVKELLDKEGGEAVLGRVEPPPPPPPEGVGFPPQQATSATPRSGTPVEGGPWPTLGIEIMEGITTEGVYTKFSDGVAVVSVKGPAQTAGIAPKDIILAINNQRVRNLAEFNAIAGRLVPLSTVIFKIKRGERFLHTEVKVGSSAVKPGGKFRNIIKTDANSPRSQM